jgi:hypothetical protein
MMMRDMGKGKRGEKDMKLKISEMTGKLANIPALNTNPLSNPFCIKMQVCEGSICSKCYSCSMLKTFRSGCIPAWEGNGKILSEGPLDPADIPTIASVYFRFGAHGELLNDAHFLNLCAVARANPRTRFVLWTKRKDIVNRNRAEVPANMGLIWSNPMLDKVVKKAPRGFDKVFNVVTEQSNRVNCGGKKCWDCAKCYDPQDKDQCIIEKLK